MAIIQKAHGTDGVAVFATPTQPGNMVVVAACKRALDNDLSVTTDNTGGLTHYSNGQPFTQNSNVCARISYSQDGFRPGGTQTVTVSDGDGHSTGIKVWIYEISGMVENLEDYIGDNSNVGPPVTSGLELNLSLFHYVPNVQPPPNQASFWLLSLCCLTDGAVSGVNSPWTLDDIQDGDAPAFLYVPDATVYSGSDPITEFSGSTSGFAIVSAAFNQQLESPVETGNIIVEKVTHPSGSEQGFEFTTDYGEPFTLHDGEQNNSGLLGPGTYTITETPVEGWETGMLARDQEGHIVTIREDGSFDLLAGQTVTVTVTNTIQKVIVAKEITPPGNLQEFTFHRSWGADFTLQGGDTNDSGRLEPGTYSVAEDPIEGWRTSVAAVDSDGNPVAIAEDGSFPLAAGQIITVTFSNVPPSPPGPNHILTMSYFNGWHDPLMMTLSGEWVANRQARRWNIDPIPTRAMALVKRTLAAKVDQRVNYRQLLLGKYAAMAGPASLLYMQPGAYDDLGVGYESKYRLAYSSEKPSQEFPAGGRVMGWRAYDGHALGQGMLLISPWTPDPTYTHEPYQRDLSAGKKQIPGSAPVTHIDGSLKADSEFFTLEFSNGGVAGAWFQLVELAAFGRAKVYSAG